MYFKPPKSILVYGWCLWPLIVGGIATYFFYDNLLWVIICGDVFLGLLSLYILVSTVIAMLTQVYIDNLMIAKRSIIGNQAIHWDDVNDAFLYTRENGYSRADTMLILKGNEQLLTFNPSAFSPEDEKSIISFVRSKVDLLNKTGIPSI